jgi:hypothetical protein
MVMPTDRKIHEAPEPEEARHAARYRRLQQHQQHAAADERPGQKRGVE